MIGENGMETQVLIIGAGLSGLHTSYVLGQRDVPALLVEARPRLGGRILSRNGGGADRYDIAKPGFDLGPTWFWPGQMRIAAVLEELDLSQHVFEQAGRGDALYEDAQGVIHRGIHGISMAGSYRLAGGIQQLTESLAARINEDVILRNARATRLERREDCIVTELLWNGEQRQVTSNAVVIALPPRLAVSTIGFEPALDAQRKAELQAVATWMAGHAKIVTFYQEPFWLERGLSGDAMSQRGPLHEIHDASPKQGGPYALFGFVGIPAAIRRNREQALRATAIEQLTRLFGDAAAKPLDQYVKDWASDPCTATADDQQMLGHHAPNRLSALSEPSWQHRLIWSGSETARSGTRSNGYLEGALEASERTLEALRELRYMAP